MDLQFIGANSVQLSDKNFNLVVDPYLYNAKLPTGVLKKSPIVLLTQEWPDLKLPEDAFVIDCPGEYEVAGLTIKGVAAQLHTDTPDQPKKSVIYRIITNDYNIGFFGHIAPALDEDQLEEIGLLDIMSLPVGGNGYTMDAIGAAQLVRNIEPKITIPTHYKQSGIEYPVSQDEVSKFTTEMGSNSTREDKLKLKGTLPDTPQITVLNPTL